MKRDFLKELGLEDAVIDKIMAEHGKTVTRLNDKIGAKNTEYEQLKGDYEKAQNEVNEFKKIDIESLKSEANEWKAKYEAYETDAAINKYFEQYKFTSELAKKATITEFKNQKFKLKDGKFEGADDFMKKFVEENKSAFEEENDNKNSGTDLRNGGNPYYQYQPSAGGNGGSDAFLSGLSDIFGESIINNK